MNNQQRIEERKRAEDQDRRYAEAFPGWREKWNLPRYPRMVAGKRCLIGYPSMRMGCICQEYYHRVFDHTRIWQTPEGYRVLTAEPYDLKISDISALEARCRELGLAVELFPYSPYLPGHTTMLLIHRSDQAVQHDLVGREPVEGAE